jgi:hypothetical protein
MAKYIDLGKMVLIESKQSTERDLNKFFITFSAIPKIGQVVTSEMISSTTEWTDGFMEIQDTTRWDKLKNSNRDWRVETFYNELLKFIILVANDEWALYESLVKSCCFSTQAHQIAVVLKNNPLYTGVTPTLVESKS